jgi:serine/threonine protein kinase
MLGQVLQVENTKVGPFLIIRRLGSHRRQKVYHARQTEQGRDVALKFLQLPDDVPREEALGRINHEVRVIRRLDHRNIVRLYGAGTEQDQVFLAHELVDGESLYSVLRRLGKLAPDLVIDYGTQLARALEYVHENELIHGNLTTEKVIITGTGQVKLADVRLNRPRKRRWDAPRRATLESAAYMSPEQLLGEGSTHQSDLYSLGVVLYEMLTGRLPFEPRSMRQLARDKQANQVQKVTHHVMNCPAWLDQLIMQLIRSRPRERPWNAHAVILTLEQIRSVDQGQQSVAEEMTRGFSALTAGRDRTEARRLLGKKPEPEPSSKGPLLQSLPFLAVGLVLVTLLISLLAFWPFSPPAADRLTQANALMQSSDPADWQEARRLYQRVVDSADQTLAEEARRQYYLSRRKSMLFRLDRTVSGLEKPEIREFNRGYQLQKQRRADEALAFFQQFVDNYDRENRLVYVYDEAKERLDQLTKDKQQSIDKGQQISEALSTADELAVSPETRQQAHRIWNDVLQEYGSNDFLQLEVQRAVTGITAFPLAETGAAPDKSLPASGTVPSSPPASDSGRSADDRESSEQDRAGNGPEAA